MPRATPMDEGDLQRRVVAFVRAFGLHRPDETPCGATVPVSEAHALAVLRDDGPMPQRALAVHLALTKSTVSRLVDQLEHRGFVTRRIDGRDARCRVVELTELGAHTAAEIEQRRRQRMSALLDRLPAHDVPSVLAALDLLVEAARET